MTFFPFSLLKIPETHLSWLLHLTGFLIFHYPSLYNFPFSLCFLFALLFPLKTLKPLYKNVVLASANLIFRFCLVFLLFFVMRMRCALRLRPAQGSLFPLPHVLVDFCVYTYKFTFYYHIITTHVSFLYAATTSDCWCSPTTFNCRWSPTTPDDIRWFPEPLFPNISWLTFGNQSEGSKDSQTHVLNNVSYTDDQWCSLQVNFLKCRLFQHFLIQFLIMSSQSQLALTNTRKVRLGLFADFYLKLIS